MQDSPRPDPNCSSCVALAARLAELEEVVRKQGAKLDQLEGLEAEDLADVEQAALERSAVGWPAPEPEAVR